MLITRTSPLTGKTNTRDLPITKEQLNAWHSGTYIQVAMPNLSPSEREFIMTGLTEEDWNNTFLPPLEDEDEF
jgi:hypothetical protein